MPVTKKIRSELSQVIPVRAKAVIRDGREALSAEYEECRRIALERKISILEVMRLLDRELSQAGTS